MGVLAKIYRESLGLLTDLYQLTMAYGYWKLGKAEQEAVFHLTFRKAPFEGGYAIAAGLDYVVEYLQNLHFSDEDLDYLGSLRGNDERPLFGREFVEYLRRFEFTCDVDAIVEGSVVFAHEPLVRVRGPILQGQIIETALLNMINFQTLVATKACRVCQAARGDAVLEFGLRRAQGIDGALSATRASYIGGCAATSNVLAGKLFNIPVKGTHAHSWVMSFEDELESFEAYARAMPNNCVFLVDTYNTLQGVRHAVEIGKRLRAQGHELMGIRLDSGDLAYLSIEARKILDDAGFAGAQILASNDLDEQIISSLKEQGARIVSWGVGTKLATSYDQPALGGVYKLSALRERSGKWAYKLKLSEQTAKVSNPGILQVRRYFDGSYYVGDAIYSEPEGIGLPVTIIDPTDSTRRKGIDRAMAHEDLLRPIFRGGKLVYAMEGLEEIRARVQRDLSRLHPGTKRFLNPHRYPAGLEQSLHELKIELILRAREANTGSGK